MIIWSGAGFLVPVYVFGSALLCNFGFDGLWGAGYYSSHKWAVGVAMFLAAGLTLATDLVLDKRTGRPLNHSLFFIPIFFWAPILAIIGMLAAWRLFDVVFQPVFLTAVNLLFPGVRYS